MAGSEFEEQPQLAMMLWRAGLPQQFEIVAIHGQDAIETLEIGTIDLPRLERAQIVATARRRL